MALNRSRKSLNRASFYSNEIVSFEREHEYDDVDSVVAADAFQRMKRSSIALSHPLTTNDQREQQKPAKASFLNMF